ncbi:MAG: hypothetical protein ACXWN4_01395 [Candidatus Limnocylindrales bacterium]
MNERPGDYSEDVDEPLVRPVKLVMKGRGLPTPPLAPLVGAVGIILGLSLGFGLAPHPAPAPTALPTETAAVFPSAVSAPTAPALVRIPERTISPQPVPTDGLSLSQALRAVTDAGLGIPIDDVISANLVRLADVSSSSWSAPAGTQWVWAVTVRLGHCAVDAEGRSTALRIPALATPDNAGGVCSGDTTKLVILDYHTGSRLLAFETLP